MKPFYQEDGITLYHGDCRELLPLMGPGIEFGFADPPYGVNFKYHEDYKDNPGAEYDAMIQLTHTELSRLCNVVAITPGMRHAYDYPAPKWQMAWFKPGSTRRNGLRGFNIWEPILVYGDTPNPVYQDAIRLPYAANHATGPAADHPAPKPLALMRWLIEQLTNPGDTVIDPYAGSGTTLRAAQDTGRQAIGIELHEPYCQIITQRLAQQSLFTIQ